MPTTAELHAQGSNTIDDCQQIDIFLTTNLTNLVIALSAKPFTKWSLDCTIKLARRYLGNEYIIVAIDYATKWIKVKPFELL
jgi:hypothetical protein